MCFAASGRPELDNEELLYHGLVKEGGTEVEIAPSIRLKPGLYFTFMVSFYLHVYRRNSKEWPDFSNYVNSQFFWPLTFCHLELCHLVLQLFILMKCIFYCAFLQRLFGVRF